MKQLKPQKTTSKFILKTEYKIKELKKDIPKRLTSEETLELTKKEVRDYRKKLTILHRLEFNLEEAKRKLKEKQELSDKNENESNEEKLFEQVLENINFLGICQNRQKMRKLCLFLMQKRGTF